VVRTLSLGQASEILEVVQDGSAKRFALKQLLESRSADPDERKAFEHEAKIGMELSHPNLIRVYEYIKEKKERPYFVMELFPSQHLRLPIGRPKVYPLPGERKHRVVEQIAGALAYMHDKGWVHRDIKPENILFNKAGEARLIDYALALRIKSGLSKLFGKVKCQGTRSYMSPEQIRCVAPTPTSDIYSLGITCYELACGRQPFRANSETELLTKHLKEVPVPPTLHNPEITNDFSELVLKMIRKRPSERVQTLHEFLHKFNTVRIYKDDPDPRAGRNGF
jgi:serine/threonine protein kinase